MIELFPPRWGELVVWTVLYGVPVGVGLSFWKHKNEQHKAENTEKVCHVTSYVEWHDGTAQAWQH